MQPSRRAQNNSSTKSRINSSLIDGFQYVSFISVPLGPPLIPRRGLHEYCLLTFPPQRCGCVGAECVAHDGKFSGFSPVVP